MSTNEVQKTIDSIVAGSLSEEALVSLLTDASALVRANVLMSLPKRNIVDTRMVVEAVVKAASNPTHGDVKLMGTVNQRRLAIATLAWINSDASIAAYESLLEGLTGEEIAHVTKLVSQGPIG